MYRYSETACNTKYTVNSNQHGVKVHVQRTTSVQRRCHLQRTHVHSGIGRSAVRHVTGSEFQASVTVQVYDGNIERANIPKTSLALIFRRYIHFQILVQTKLSAAQKPNRLKG